MHNHVTPYIPYGNPVPQDVHEKSQLHSAELQRRLESQIVELQSEAKTRAFELSHLKVVVGEKEGLLARANLHIDMLQEKLQASMERYRALESDVAVAQRTGAGGGGGALALLPAPAGLASAVTAVGGGGGLSPEHEARLSALRKEKEALTLQVGCVWWICTVHISVASSPAPHDTSTDHQPSAPRNGYQPLHACSSARSSML